MVNNGSFNSMIGILIAFGSAVSIIIICLLIYSMLRTALKTVTSIEIKVSSIVCLICYVIWEIFVIFNQAVIPRHLCGIRMAFGVPPFLLTRAALNYFLILRTELSFVGTPLEFRAKFIKTIKIIICAVYGTTALFFTITAQFQTYVDGLCRPSDQILGVFMIVTMIYVVTDLFLGIFCVTVYLCRLHKIQKVFAAAQLDEIQKGDESLDQAKDDGLKYIIKKQSKLAFISFVTTIIFVYINDISPYLFVFMYLDGIINAFCVYCTFEANDRYYRYVCNCNGNRCLQYTFCFCCCLGNCNAQSRLRQEKTKTDDLQLKHVSTNTGSTQIVADISTTTKSEGVSDVTMEIH